MLFLFILIIPLLGIVAFLIFDSLGRTGNKKLRNSIPVCSKCGFNIPMEDNNPRTRWKCPVCGVGTSFWEHRLPAVATPELMESDQNGSIEDFRNHLDDRGRTPVERLLDEPDKEEEVEKDEH